MPQEGARRKNPQSGKLEVFHQSRWHTVDVRDKNTRNGKQKEYRVDGGKWESGGQMGEYVQDEQATRFNSAELAGVKDPEHIEAEPKRHKVVGTGRTPGKPWQYDSPMDYIMAWSNVAPRTKVGKWLYDIVNTANWLRDYYANRQITEENKEQNDAIDQGYSDAMQNFDSWCGNIKPDRDADKLGSTTLNAIYRGLGRKMAQLQPQYEQAKGKNDPESLRIKTEYQTYMRMSNRMEEMLGNSIDREERARQKQKDRESHAREMEELRARARSAGAQANAVRGSGTPRATPQGADVPTNAGLSPKR